MLVPLESSSAVLVMISDKTVSICKCLHGLRICVWFYPNKLMMMMMNRFHARWANSGKRTISKRVPLFDALVRGEAPHPAAPTLPH